MDEIIVTPQITQLRKLLETTKTHILLLGLAGSGKTTLVKHLLGVLDYARWEPIYVNVGRPAGRGLTYEVAHSILEYLGSAWSKEVPSADDTAVRELADQIMQHPGETDSSGMLEHLLNLRAALLSPDQRLLLILDGLDEAEDPDRVAYRIERLSRDLHPNVKLLISSRAGSFTERLQQVPKVLPFYLTGLSSEEALIFIERLLARRPEPALAEQLISTAQGSPLLLSILVEQFERTGVVPSATPSSVRSAIQTMLAYVPSDVRRVLQLLAIFEPVSAAFLAEVTGRNLAWIEQNIERLAFLGEGSSNMLHLHTAVRSVVLEEAGFANTIDVSKLQFGEEAAERDTLLSTNFVDRPDLQRIFEGTKTITLGDRGAGKSALFSVLDAKATSEVVIELSQTALSDQVLLIATSHYPADFLQRITADDTKISSADKFKAFWLLYTAVLAASKIHDRVNGTTNKGKAYIQSARKILRSVGWARTFKGEGRLTRLWVGLRSFSATKISFRVGPVTIEPLASQNASKGRNQIEVVDFIKQTDEVLGSINSRLLVVFDQIDEAYKYQRDIQESLVQGLLLAEAFVAQMQRIRLVVFLRTDLFEIYDIQEKNKFVSRTIRLEWSRNDLLTLLVRRLYANEALTMVSNRLHELLGADHDSTSAALRIAFSAEVEGIPFVEWLLENLRNGNQRISPRQIILFLNITRDRAAATDRTSSGTIPLFNERSIAEAMTRLSELSYQEVINDFRIATSFVLNCRAAKMKEFAIQEVESLFETTEGPISKQVESLERLGFLERYVSRREGQLTTRFRIPQLFTRWWEI